MKFNRNFHLHAWIGVKIESISFIQLFFFYRKMRNDQVIPVVVGITLCTASAALFYKWYKTRNGGDAVDGASRPKRAIQQKTKVELKIPNESLQLVRFFFVV